MKRNRRATCRGAARRSPKCKTSGPVRGSRHRLRRARFARRWSWEHLWEPTALSAEFQLRPCCAEKIDSCIGGEIKMVMAFVPGDGVGVPGADCPGASGGEPT